MKSAVIVGLGIGQVYESELKKLGYAVTTVDPDPNKKADFKDLEQCMHSLDHRFSVAVICTPNFLHYEQARVLGYIADQVFIEKPGVGSAELLYQLQDEHPDTQFRVVDNNRYRSEIPVLKALVPLMESIDIIWTNHDRIPFPGSWFTTKEKAFGGVSHDLMPHILTFVDALFEPPFLEDSIFLKSAQMHDLKYIDSTDYGVVNPNGIYDVDDISMFTAEIGGVKITGKAAWRYGQDQREIIIRLKSGPVIEYDFGLCPAEAYGKMISDPDPDNSFTFSLHRILSSQNKMVSPAELLKEFQK